MVFFIASIIKKQDSRGAARRLLTHNVTSEKAKALDRKLLLTHGCNFDAFEIILIMLRRVTKVLRLYCLLAVSVHMIAWKNVSL